jgi:Na+-driven multidrug efflux pump
MFALFDANRLYLNSMEETNQGTIILIFGLPIHALICYYFVHVLNFGVVGLAFAIDITYCLFLLTMTLYCVFTSNTKVRDSWVTPDGEALE